MLLLIPQDFGPADLMIFSAPHSSVRLLNPPQDDNLTDELLEFARRRPYGNCIQTWRNSANVTTKEIAQEIQILEELNKTLPDLVEDSFLTNISILKLTNPKVTAIV